MTRIVTNNTEPHPNAQSLCRICCGDGWVCVVHGSDGSPAPAVPCPCTGRCPNHLIPAIMDRYGLEEGQPITWIINPVKPLAPKPKELGTIARYNYEPRPHQIPSGYRRTMGAIFRKQTPE